MALVLPTLEEVRAELARRRERQQAWLSVARPEQLPPPGDWSTWYVRGGRGAGKTRTGAETLARWIRDYPPNPSRPGVWAIVAPTFVGDARRKCIEGESGVLKALGDEVENYNRGEGVVTLKSGAKIVADGADDGARRIQGENLSGVWADEVGLWQRWDEAWNESIRFAVRFEPGLIIATGTPKMAHPLIAHLLASPHVAVTHMRTADNIANLDERTVNELYEQYAGSTLGRQELEGEFIEALEGEILRREHWRFYDVAASWWAQGEIDTSGLPAFEKIVHSWDTALKAKTSSDHVAGQVWGVKGPDRFLLRLWHGHAGLEATVAAMRELRSWSGEHWPDVAQYVLIENAANGPEALAKMREHVDGVLPIRVDGDKTRRALTAAPALETGHCFLPGRKNPEQGSRGYTQDTPPEVQAFIEEAAQFRGDQKHRYDDQVDAWSQMVNWTRQPTRSRARTSKPTGRWRPGSLQGARSW